MTPSEWRLGKRVDNSSMADDDGVRYGLYCRPADAHKPKHPGEPYFKTPRNFVKRGNVCFPVYDTEGLRSPPDKLFGKAGLTTPDLTKACYANLAVPVPFDNSWNFLYDLNEEDSRNVDKKFRLMIQSWAAPTSRSIQGEIETGQIVRVGDTQQEGMVISHSSYNNRKYSVVILFRTDLHAISYSRLQLQFNLIFINLPLKQLPKNLLNQFFKCRVFFCSRLFIQKFSIVQREFTHV